MDLIQLIPYIGYIAILVVAWKTNTSKGKDDAAATWQSVAEATKQQFQLYKEEQNCKINELSEKIAILEVKVNAYAVENKGLKNELEVIKKVKPDTEFVSMISNILARLEVVVETQNKIWESFAYHSEQDDKRFSNIGSLVEETNKLIKELKKEG